MISSLEQWLWPQTMFRRHGIQCFSSWYVSHYHIGAILTDRQSYSSSDVSEQQQRGEAINSGSAVVSQPFRAFVPVSNDIGIYGLTVWAILCITILVSEVRKGGSIRTDRFYNNSGWKSQTYVYLLGWQYSTIASGVVSSLSSEMSYIADVYRTHLLSELDFHRKLGLN